MQRGVLQADPSEWETVRAEARRQDRLWLIEKLEQTNVSTLRRYVTAAQVPLGRNPSKDA